MHARPHKFLVSLYIFHIRNASKLVSWSPLIYRYDTWRMVVGQTYCYHYTAHSNMSRFGYAVKGNCFYCNKYNYTSQWRAVSKRDYVEWHQLSTKLHLQVISLWCGRYHGALLFVIIFKMLPERVISLH